MVSTAISKQLIAENEYYCSYKEYGDDVNSLSVGIIVQKQNDSNYYQIIELLERKTPFKCFIIALNISLITQIHDDDDLVTCANELFVSLPFAGLNIIEQFSFDNNLVTRFEEQLKTIKQDFFHNIEIVPKNNAQEVSKATTPIPNNEQQVNASQTQEQQQQASASQIQEKQQQSKRKLKAKPKPPRRSSRKRKNREEEETEVNVVEDDEPVRKKRKKVEKKTKQSEKASDRVEGEISKLMQMQIEMQEQHNLLLNEIKQLKNAQRIASAVPQTSTPAPAPALATPIATPIQAASISAASAPMSFLPQSLTPITVSPMQQFIPASPQPTIVLVLPQQDNSWYNLMRSVQNLQLYRP